MYGPDDPPLTQLFREATAQNEEVVGTLAGDRIALIEELLDIQYSIASHVVWAMDTLVGMQPVNRLLFSAFHKNLVATLSAVELSRRGLHGSVGSLLRHVFEALVLAKFCSVGKDQVLATKWLEGELIYIGKMVLKRIQAPDPAPLWEVWGMLSDQTHATTQAQQVALHIADNPRDVRTTFAIVQMLVECNYHLLNSHLINSALLYYAKMYRTPYELPALRARAKQLIRAARPGQGEAATLFVRVFQAKWQLA
jgi:hypothetical protein